MVSWSEPQLFCASDCGFKKRHRLKKASLLVNNIKSSSPEALSTFPYIHLYRNTTTMLFNEAASAFFQAPATVFNVACSTTPAVVLLVAIMVAVAAYGVCWFFHLGRWSTAVPYAPIGFLELLRTAATKHAAWGLLGLRHSSGLLNFRLRIPVPKGFYMVGDYTLAKEILHEKGSDKPSSLYRQIQMHKSKGDVFVGPNSAHWKMARQSAMYAFSPKEVRRMTSVCEIHVQ